MKTKTNSPDVLARRAVQRKVALRNAERKAALLVEIAKRAKATAKAARKTHKESRKAARRAAKKARRLAKELAQFLKANAKGIHKSRTANAPASPGRRVARKAAARTVKLHRAAPVPVEVLGVEPPNAGHAIADSVARR